MPNQNQYNIHKHTFSKSVSLFGNWFLTFCAVFACKCKQRLQSNPLPTVCSSVAFLATDKTITSKLRFFRPRILILGQGTLSLGVFPLCGWATPLLRHGYFSCGQIYLKQPAHFGCRWVSLNGLAHNMALWECEIVALGQLHGWILC